MRIVIDLQGMQSASSRNRGIGRYTSAFIEAIVKNNSCHEIILAVSNFYPETIDSIRDKFQDYIPKENIRTWHAKGPVSFLSQDIQTRKATELLREAFIASLNPSIVLITSLFEGFDSDAVTSVGAFDRKVLTAVILYDLIPLIYRNQYLNNPLLEEWYENKLNHLRRADLLLAISESSRQEAIQYLGFPKDKVLNISSGINNQFTVKNIPKDEKDNILKKYGIHKPFIMYTGGVDHRKNLEGLLTAYSDLPNTLKDTHQLAIVCSLSQDERAHLESIAKGNKILNNLCLTGFVSEDDLVSLYNLCKLFIFPSWHEGFGLPILEAMACGCAVIGSNTSSIPEVIEYPDSLFDPLNTESITQKLVQVLEDEEFLIKIKNHSFSQVKKFSWDNTAKLAIQGIENYLSKENKPLNAHRPKLAYISPLPPERSGISDYSADLLPELARHYDIEVIVNQDSIQSAWIKANCPIRTVTWFRANSKKFDRILYHFGNSTFHQHMFSLLEEIPGVVVLHDFFLSGIANHIELEKGDFSFVKNLYEGHGYKAVHRRFNISEDPDPILTYPCNQQVLENALGIIVHSENSERLLKTWYGKNTNINLTVIPLLKVPSLISDQKRQQARDILGFYPGDFVICSFGMLSATKLNHRLLEAWINSSIAEIEHCKLVFVGENNLDTEYGQTIVQLIKSSQFKNRIIITGWVDTETFHKFLSAADLGVQLRTLSRGETSAAVLDCMNYGLATIINENGSMKDLPNHSVYKLPDEFTDVQLTHAIQFFLDNSKARKELGSNAKKTIIDHHTPRVCADLYQQAIESFNYIESTNINNLIYRLSEYIESPTLSKSLAQSIDKSIPTRIRKKQLLIDVSELFEKINSPRILELISNIKALLKKLLLCSSNEYRVEPIYFDLDRKVYLFARKFTLTLLNCPPNLLNDEAINYYSGDYFIGLAKQAANNSTQELVYNDMYRQGVSINLLTYSSPSFITPEEPSSTLKKEINLITISDKLLNEFNRLEAFGDLSKGSFSVIKSDNNLIKIKTSEKSLLEASYSNILDKLLEIIAKQS